MERNNNEQEITRKNIFNEIKYKKKKLKFKKKFLFFFFFFNFCQKTSWRIQRKGKTLQRSVFSRTIFH